MIENCDQGRFAYFHQYFSNLRRKVEMTRMTELEESVGCLDGREPDIACPHPVAPVPLEKFEAFEKRRDVEMTDFEPAWPGAVPDCGCVDQPTRRICKRLIGRLVNVRIGEVWLPTCLVCSFLA